MKVNALQTNKIKTYNFFFLIPEKSVIYRCHLNSFSSHIGGHIHLVTNHSLVEVTTVYLQTIILAHSKKQWNKQTISKDNFYFLMNHYQVIFLARIFAPILLRIVENNTRCSQLMAKLIKYIFNLTNGLND